MSWSLHPAPLGIRFERFPVRHTLLGYPFEAPPDFYYRQPRPYQFLTMSTFTTGGGATNSLSIWLVSRNIMI